MIAGFKPGARKPSPTVERLSEEMDFQLANRFSAIMEALAPSKPGSSHFKVCKAFFMTLTLIEAELLKVYAVAQKGKPLLEFKIRVNHNEPYM